MTYNDTAHAAHDTASSLFAPPISNLLTRLFAEAEDADAPFRAELRSMAQQERDALMSSARSDYRAFYGRARDMFLPVSKETGTLLYMLARAIKPRTVVEFGTSFGISTIHLAAALKDNGGGRVIGSEFEAKKAARARQNLEAAGLSAFVEIREGDAKETLRHGLGAGVEMVLLDGAKVLYPEVLALLEPHLSRGAVIVADNADDSPDYLARVRDPKHGYASVPFGADVELSTRL